MRSARSELSIKAVGKRLRQILEQYCALGTENTDSPFQKFGSLGAPPIDECFDVPLPPSTEGSATLERLPEAVSQAICPVFTVVTPAYNTPPEFLADLYNDLVAQTFSGWEWCICDDSSDRLETLSALGELRRKDARVRIRFLSKNVGISTATNTAVSMANGEYLLMVDHDDRLEPNILQEYLREIRGRQPASIYYCDEDKLDRYGVVCDPFYKPDWSPEYAMSTMYVLHCLCIRKSDFLALGGYRQGYEGAQDHDFILRAVARGLVPRHVDQLLYHWRKASGSTAETGFAKEFAIEAGRRAVAAYLADLQLDGTVEHGLFPGTYRARPRISPGRVSLNILTACTQMRTGGTYVERFVRSILEHAGDGPIDFEIRVVMDELRGDLAAPLAQLDPRVRLVPFKRHRVNFNFAEKANFAVTTSECDRIVLLNDDMEVINSGWLEALLEMLELPGVGVVGGRLLRDNKTIQHAGIVLGIYECCAHVFQDIASDRIGVNAFNPHVIRNYSAVTGALMAFRRSTFNAIGGFGPNFPIEFNDLDFCLRGMELGFRIVYTPYAELKHFESRSAQRLMPDPLDTLRFRSKWGWVIDRDPHYNRHLSRSSIMFEPALTTEPDRGFADQQPAGAGAAGTAAGSAAMQQDLIASLLAQGFMISDDLDLHVVVDGLAIRGTPADDGAYRFRLPDELPDEVRDLRIVSRTFVPRTITANSPDTRRLGVCLGEISVHAQGNVRDVGITDPALNEGFHAPETEGSWRWRWTDGDARLPIALLGEATEDLVLELRLVCKGRYWTRQDGVQSARPENGELISKS